jgi:hypothetical protein
VLAIDLPRTHARQTRACERDAAIARIGRVEVLEAGVADRITVGRAIRLAHDAEHLAPERIELVIALCVEPLAQCNHAVDHLLTRYAPGVRMELDFVAMPRAECAHARQVVVGELLPRDLAIEGKRRIGQCCLQLDESGKARDRLPCLVVLKRRAEGDQRIPERVVARQHLHRRP